MLLITLKLGMSKSCAPEIPTGSAHLECPQDLPPILCMQGQAECTAQHLSLHREVLLALDHARRGAVQCMLDNMPSIMVACI